MTTPPARTARIVDLAGGLNFRDVGGYRTRDGRILKWGRVFRAGVLSYFAPSDEQRLKELGVRVICDLRRADERRRECTRWPDAATQHLSWDDGQTPPSIQSLAVHHPRTAAGMHAAMIDLYRALPAWLAPRLRDMLARIAQGDLPLVVHCAAGKDRTGVAIALLLAALDVPHDTVVKDYLLTNDVCDFMQFILSRREAQLGVALNDHPLLSLPEDMRRVLFGAHIDFLNAALEQIARDHGGLTEYLRGPLGVDEALRTKLQTALLSAG